MEIHKVKQPETTKRRITARAFWNRVTKQKYAQLIGLSKEDNLLAADISMINGAEYVGLDEQDIIDAFEKLKEAGMFTEEDRERIFADSETHEVPEFLRS